MMNKKLKKLAYNSLFLLTIIVFERCGGDENDIAIKKVSMVLFDVNFDTLSGNRVITKENDEGYAGTIYVNSIDTLFFNFGYDIKNLAEHDPAVFVFPYRTDTIKIDTSIVKPQDVIFTNKPNFDIDEFRKQNVYFDTVSGLHAKITVPRRVGRGITGVYIDSIKSDAGGRLKFNFYAKDLDSIKQERMLKVIRSIKLKVR